MDEKKIIFVWFSRFNEVNKGVLRILGIISLVGVIAPILYLLITSIIANQEGYIVYWIDGIYVVVGILICYCLFWILFRIILWVYDGFQESKNDTNNKTDID